MKPLMIKKLLICLCLSALTLGNAHAAPLDVTRQQFQQVRADLQAGKVDSFVALPAALRAYPLYPWLEYEYLKLSGAAIPDAKLVAFVQSYPHSVLADEFSPVLAERLANKQAWQTLLETLPATLNATAVRCYRAQALAATGQKEAALTEGKAAWLQIEKNFPAACEPVTALLRAHVQLSTDDYWQRIQVAVEKNQSTLATQLAADLPPDQQAAVAVWVAMRQDPTTALENALKQPESAALRGAIGFGLARLAKKESKTAESVWQRARQVFHFTPEESAVVESALGVSQAIGHDAAAIARLAAIPDALRSQEASQWLVRIAARENDWARVLQAAQSIKTDNERDAVPWQYWQARALEALGKKSEASSLYAKLTPHTTFYGFLASDHLGQDYRALAEPLVDRQQRISGLQRVAAVQRAFEWFALGEREQGRKEWFRALTPMDHEGKLAAAELALQSSDPNLAIWTLSRAKAWSEVNLRFPVVHADLVNKQAAVQGVLPAWVLGVMRRESAFDATAASSANAFGLMQVILPTAKDVGRKLGISINTKDDVFPLETNVQLGSAYLAQMLTRFNGDYAQATAAYNAGPGRPPKWSPRQTLSADQWVESIPFNETRDYVQAVMAYTTIYDYRLNEGKGRRLSERLPPITPNAKKFTPDP
jgi:soluble lytic murein transglycosylase